MPSNADLAPCDHCGEPIWWTITAAGNRMPVDPEPTEDGNTAVYVDGVGTIRSRRITDDYPLQSYEQQVKPHAATCSNRPPRRRTRPGRRRAIVRYQDWPRP